MKPPMPRQVLQLAQYYEKITNLNATRKGVSA